MYVIAKILVMFSIISSADSGAQIQTLRRISPIGDIHIAQVETLMKDKEGNYEEDFDETSLLYSLHAWPVQSYLQNWLLKTVS